ncbi:MAG: pyridoxal 5'-phosphate synthase glutaminase subunit PdxT [Solirubrobacteraceae bacterium]
MGSPPVLQRTPLIGVLALQGDFDAHRRVLEGLRARVREVRIPADLDGLEGLVIPGGESTTMTLGIAREGLAVPLRRLAGVDEEGGRIAGSGGVPVLGSCAGLIMLDRDHLGIMDIRAERNAFGRQLRSFEADLDVKGLSGGPMHGIFIRAPWIAEHGPDVEILAEIEGHPVAARQGRVTAVAFHTELGADERLHRLFLADVAASSGSDESVVSAA